ncbi:MAG: hypothetical protein AAGI23_09425 [Bacteroidota bacterium]
MKIQNEADVFEQEYGCTGCTLQTTTDIFSIDDTIQKYPEVQVVFRGTSSYPSYVNFGNDLWADGKALFMPYGSNNFELGTNASSDNVIIVGAGVSQNQTMYGSQLMFWDTPPAPYASNSSSIANAVIAAKFLKVMEGIDTTNIAALVACQETASENGIRTLENGYGKIDVPKAIAYYEPDTLQISVGETKLMEIEGEGSSLIMKDAMNQVWKISIDTLGNFVNQKI